MPTSGQGLSAATIEQLITQSVAEAMAAYEANQNNRDGDGNPHVMLEGTEGVVGLTRWSGNQASAFVSNVPNRNNFQRNNQNVSNGPSRPNILNNKQGGGSGLVCENLGQYDRANQHMTYTDKELDNVLDISHLKIKLAKENKIIVAFDESRCYFLNKDLNLRNILGTGNQCEGLYYYNDQGIKSNLSVPDYQCYLSQHDRHCRLGHPAEPVLNVLKGSLQIDNMDKNVYCETRQRAKQTIEPFSLSDHVSKSLGDLVHLDLWGPYQVTSSEGFRYFLTVVDDFTRAVWVYLIKSKDEVPHLITIFYNLIENQFKRKIKVFRSDNKTEFVNQIVNSFCAEKMIIHQNSGAYTPQPNGIAERKHKHLLNVSRSLLFQGEFL
ncbi:ribonuclease H-like domain-containing protein [Tanacetum coccineum]|uniref:Ribonuclease H-like domain-containing protein n=1 Tax=Tanacetum coccineum TaxID=301880 RepID=A0ABQ5HEE8_9ASTR